MNEIFETKKQYWVIFLIVGILITGLGIFFACRPDASFTAISIFLVIFFLVTGICGIISTIKNRKGILGWGAALAGYILAFISGILLLVIPGLSDTLLCIFVGAGFLCNGISLIVSSFTIRSFVGGVWVLNFILGIIIVMSLQFRAITKRY